MKSACDITLLLLNGILQIQCKLAGFSFAECRILNAELTKTYIRLDTHLQKYVSFQLLNGDVVVTWQLTRQSLGKTCMDPMLSIQHLAFSKKKTKTYRSQAAHQPIARFSQQFAGTWLHMYIYNQGVATHEHKSISQDYQHVVHLRHRHVCRVGFN